MIPNLIMNKNLTKNKKGVFSCELVFDFYDHFGLDSGDLISFDNTPLRTGFQGWYILQHFNGSDTVLELVILHIGDVTN